MPGGDNGVQIAGIHPKRQGRPSRRHDGDPACVSLRNGREAGHVPFQDVARQPSPTGRLKIPLTTRWYKPKRKERS